MKKWEKLVDLLKENKNILAIGLEGSGGMNYLDKFSDIDLFVISKKGYPIPKLISLLKNEKFDIHPHPEILKNLNSFSLRTQDRRVDIKLIEEDKFDNKIDKNLKIIFDSKNIFKKSKIKKTPKKDFQFNYRMIVYPLRIKKHFEVCKTRNNYLFLYDIIHLCVEILIKIIYALNKKEFICLKWAMRDIEKMDVKPKSFKKRINKIISYGNSEKDLKKQTDEILKLGKETYNFILRDFPGIKKFKDHVEWVDK